MQPVIYGMAGTSLSADERDFFRDSDPAGYILFRRNCEDKEQLRALTDDLRSIHGRGDVPILMDQEGGRVVRMGPPAWPEFPCAGKFAELYRRAPASAIEAARANAQAIALIMKESGVNVNCLPLLDVRQEGADDIIGDRALGREPMQVAALGRAVLEGMAAAGVVGVIKHIPGHGRATADSHKEMPVVDAAEDALEIDLEPFISLRHAPMGMTSHIVYTAWDDERPASLSPVVIEAIIRGRIGFDGLLMSDDICMHALSGSFAERARGVTEAGCDLALHCSGDMAEMVSASSGLGEMSGRTRERLERAMASVAAADNGASYEALAARRDSLLAYA
ncbi:MAG TPA: beta-N-acetylhexosaminidase [Allosphingosinicella sp.]|nr:beta-N-acetylhexosaminidase [Allosphingosinicella sp.]